MAERILASEKPLDMAYIGKYVNNKDPVLGLVQEEKVWARAEDSRYLVMLKHFFKHYLQKIA